MGRLLFMLFFCCGTPLGQRCEEIEIESCWNLGYNQTSYSNNLGHETQAAAKEDFRQFSLLLKTDCSSSLLSFLCALFFPPCTVLNRAIPPCRNLCETVQSGCRGTIEQYGFDWPENFTCDSFPEKDEGVCIPGQSLPTTAFSLETTTSTIPADKTLAFKVRYRSVCSRYRHNEERRKMIKAAAKANTDHFRVICREACIVFNTPEITCEGVTGLIMHWRTNLHMRSTPKILKKELKDRIRMQKRMLVNMASFHGSPFSYPKVNKFGELVRIVWI
ncbi:frizzled-7-B-like [Watersipora subatra]|uniref:frizzled-7-B-like n=1 Tax=Watersipora subatra TaxID=2589382 RepID=UPI00355C21A3